MCRLRSFQITQQLFRFHALAGITAQDGIDEARLRSKAKVLGQLHCFMNGGMVGDSIQPKHLIKPQLQQNAQVILLGAPFGFAGNQPIQGDLPPGNAINQFLAQPPIHSGNSFF